MIKWVPDVPDKVEDGQIWRVGLNASTARVGKETIKSYRGFGHSELFAEAAHADWERLGFKGAPSSAASFYRKMFDRVRRRDEISGVTNASANHLLAEGFYGGWIELIQHGYNRGPIYHYDLNRAYFWAGLEGLPTRIRRYDRGDKTFMVLCRVKSHQKELPVMIEQRKSRVALTNEDIDLYGIEAEVFGGVSWDEDGPMFYPESVLAELAGNVSDAVFKKCMQTYWGIYAQRRAIHREIWKSGELTKSYLLRNRDQNFLWAQIIISRVTRRVYSEAEGRARQVYVDSVLTDTPISIGEYAGDWKLVDTFPEGIVTRAPGVWTPYPIGREIKISGWHKHAGYSDVM